MIDTLYAREAAEEARSRNKAESKAEEDRLCSTCRWYKRGTAGHTSDICTYPLMPYIVKQNVLSRMIRGEDASAMILCTTARQYSSECGSEAKYWEYAP